MTYFCYGLKPSEIQAVDLQGSMPTKLLKFTKTSTRTSLLLKLVLSLSPARNVSSLVHTDYSTKLWQIKAKLRKITKIELLFSENVIDTSLRSMTGRKNEPTLVMKMLAREMLTRRSPSFLPTLWHRKLDGQRSLSPNPRFEHHIKLRTMHPFHATPHRLPPSIPSQVVRRIRSAATGDFEASHTSQ